MSNFVVYKGKRYEMVNPPGSIWDLKKSCPKMQIKITADGKSETIPLGDLQLDGE